MLPRVSPPTPDLGAAERLRDQIAHLPTEPGVYLMKDRAGAVFYVGKASSLRARVRSYFHRGDDRAFVQLLDELLETIEVVVVGSENEALLLENELIKQHRPRYNVKLRDDKAFLSLRLDTSGLRAERRGVTPAPARRFPRLEVTRRVRDDGAQYYGPYSSAQVVRQTLRLLNRHFGLRTCSDRTLVSRRRPCILFQMHRCAAPCTEEVEVTRYARRVADVQLFLGGRHHELLDELRGRMRSVSEALEYEQAARLRDQIQAVERLLHAEGRAEGRFRARDLFGYARAGNLLSLVRLPVRRGLPGQPVRHFFRDLVAPDAEVLSSLLVQHYAEIEDGELPDQVLVPFALSQAEALSVWLSERRQRAGARRWRVELKVPHRGETRRLLGLAQRNAEACLEDAQRRGDNQRQALERLQQRLRLAAPPRRIECFDVSTMQGHSSVASKVLFVDGAAAREGYRRYKIKNVEGQDDFAMLYEALTRRLRRGLEQDDLPDLLLVDGGKGQLGVARAACRDLGVTGIALAGIAKSRPRAAGATEEPQRSDERLFVPGRKDPISLRSHTAERALVEQIRDEAHRFAITYHRQRRARRTVRSALDVVPGVGPTLRRRLLRRFGSLRALRGADVAAIAQTKGVSERLAQRIVLALGASGPARERR